MEEGDRGKEKQGGIRIEKQEIEGGKDGENMKERVRRLEWEWEMREKEKRSRNIIIRGINEMKEGQEGMKRKVEQIMSEIGVEVKSERIKKGEGEEGERGGEN